MRIKNGEVLFTWPITHPCITAGWRYTDGSLHRALDMSAAIGMPIYAAEDGFVEALQTWDGKTKTGMMSYGNMILLRHNEWKGGTLRTRYAHLSAICVKPYQIVREGDIIGYVGSTGNSTGPHLHFEVQWRSQLYNPLNWLDDRFCFKNDVVKKNAGTYTSVPREGGE